MPEPPEHIRKMGGQAQEAYRAAFDSCVQRHGSEKGEDHNCYAVATRAAKKAAPGVRVGARSSG